MIQRIYYIIEFYYLLHKPFRLIHVTDQLLLIYRINHDFLGIDIYTAPHRKQEKKYEKRGKLILIYIYNIIRSTVFKRYYSVIMLKKKILFCKILYKYIEDYNNSILLPFHIIIISHLYIFI